MAQPPRRAIISFRARCHSRPGRFHVPTQVQIVIGTVLLDRKMYLVVSIVRRIEHLVPQLRSECHQRDRDRAYGEIFVRRVRSIGIRDCPTCSIRRDCIDHVVVLGERHLRHVLLSYKDYYNATPLHLSLNKDGPVPRGLEWAGNIVCRRILGGLHHQYGRI